MFLFLTFRMGLWVIRTERYNFSSCIPKKKSRKKWTNSKLWSRRRKSRSRNEKCWQTVWVTVDDDFTQQPNRTAMITVKTVQNKRSSETTFSIGFYHAFSFTKQTDGVAVHFFVNWWPRHFLGDQITISFYGSILYFWLGVIFTTNNK